MGAQRSGWGTDGNRWEPWLQMGISPGKVVCIWPTVILCAASAAKGSTGQSLDLRIGWSC